LRVIEENTLEKEIQKFEYRNGIYEGEAINNVPDGNGKVVWKSGNFFEGQFVHDVVSGYGKLYLKDIALYEGLWNDNEFLQGRCTSKDECIGLYEEGAVYEGNFIDFLLTGLGKMIRSNGEVYEGEFYEGKPHGKGKLTHSDGTVIVGTWTNGEKDYEYTDEDYENAGGDARFDNTNC
jgi:hypothetical protein